MTCVRCGGVPDTRLSENGTYLQCSHCRQVYIKLNRLSLATDSAIVLIRNLIFETPHISSGRKCGRCYTPMRKIPSSFKEKAGHLLACTKCYLISCEDTVFELLKEVALTLELSKDVFHKSVLPSKETLKGTKALPVKYDVIVPKQGGDGSESGNSLFSILKDSKGTSGLIFICLTFACLIPENLLTRIGFSPQARLLGFEGSIVLASLVHSSFLHCILSLYLSTK